MAYNQSEKINGRAALIDIINSIVYHSTAEDAARPAVVATLAIREGVKSKCTQARIDITLLGSLPVQNVVIAGLLLSAELGEFGDIWEAE